MTANAAIPRHDLDAETVVLSAAMLEAAACDQVATTLPAEAFYGPSHRRAWEAILRLRERGEPADAATVAVELKRVGASPPEGGGWMPWLARVCDAAPSVDNVRTYARAVLEAWEQRKLVDLCRAIAAEGYADVGDHRAWLDSVEARVFAATMTRATTKETLAHGSAVLRETFARMESGKPSGLVVRSGIAAVDAKATMTVGDLVVVAARPGRGKSSFAMGCAVHVGTCAPSEEEATAALVFSAEMPNAQLMDRALCTRARYPLTAWRRGVMPATTSETYLRLAESARDFRGIPLWVDDKAAPTLAHVRTKIRQVKRELARNWRMEDGRPTRLRMVGFDYIQIAGLRHEKGMTRDAQIGELTRGLKQIAKDEEVVMIALSQLNRGSEDSGDKRPKLRDLRESGNIENDADLVIGIYREEEAKVAEFLGLKQRNGPEFVVPVGWVGEYTDFRDLTEQEEREFSERAAAPAHKPKSSWGTGRKHG